MFRFGPFELDPQRFQLRRGGQSVPIQRRPFDLLHYLVQRPDVVVTKAELLESVWHGVAVTEDSLARAIMAVRVALGDDVGHPQFIHTVRGRGYRFVRPVDAVETPPSSSREPFVDRAGCSALLRERLGRLTRGAGGVLLITGDVGTGKTRTLDEIERICAAPPFAGAVASLTVRCPSGEAAPEGWLAMWLSDWLQRRGCLPADGAVTPAPVNGKDAAEDPRAARYRAFEALVAGLASLGERTPVVLMVDDLHRADAHSLSLVEWLASRVRKLPLFLACSGRTDSGDPGSERVTALARDQSTRILALEPFARAEVASYLDQILETPPAPHVIDRVFDKSHGNPLLVRELARAFAAREALRRGVSTSALIGGDAMRAAIVHHLASLPPAVVDVLTTAAVFGRSFPLAPLAAALGAGNESVLRELDQAEASRLVRRVAPDTYEFNYPLVRDSLYARLSRSERARIHAAVAQALESHTGGDCTPERASEIARHFVEAAPLGEVERATAWSLRAVGLAEAAGDRAAAIRCAELGLEALRFAQRPDAEGRRALLAACGRAPADPGA
jgi:DNA-binding winged helix-turn-helix (wHTH) protein